MSEPTIPESGEKLVPLSEGGLELELSEMESIELRTLLAANGIEAVQMGASVMPNLPYELFVPESQLADAVEAIREALSAGPAGAEEAEAAGEGPPVN